MTDQPMIVANMRIHGVGRIIDSKWFAVGSGLTSFGLPHDFNWRGFLQAVQTINPPYDCIQTKPFADYPTIYRQGKYQKRVRPQRRTIAFALFSAQPELVLKLSAITPDLYETDMIEVGRRMDYSRWINFVEIASSTRWSEVTDKIRELAAAFPQSLDAGLNKTIRSLTPVARLKDDLRDELNTWLKRLIINEESAKNRQKLERLRFIVQRQDHFIKAKKIIKDLLPMFYLIDRQTCMKPNSKKSQHPKIEDVKEYVDNVIVQARQKSKTRPVLLFAGPSLTQGSITHQKLLTFLHEITKTYQCFYVNEEAQFAEGDICGKMVTLTDMLTSQRVSK